METVTLRSRWNGGSGLAGNFNHQAGVAGGRCLVGCLALAGHGLGSLRHHGSDSCFQYHRWLQWFGRVRGGDDRAGAGPYISAGGRPATGGLVSLLGGVYDGFPFLELPPGFDLRGGWRGLPLGGSYCIDQHSSRATPPAGVALVRGTTAHLPCMGNTVLSLPQDGPGGFTKHGRRVALASADLPSLGAGHVRRRGFARHPKPKQPHHALLAGLRAFVRGAGGVFLDKYLAVAVLHAPLRGSLCCGLSDDCPIQDTGLA